MIRPRPLSPAPWIVVSVLATLLSAELATAGIPKKGQIVWASNRQDGRHEIYLMNVDQSGITRLTSEGGTYPRWSPDGKWISYSSTTDDASHVINAATREDKKVCDGWPAFWMPDGKGLVCDDYGNAATIVDPQTGTSKPFYEYADFAQLKGAILEPMGITHDSRWIVGWSDRYRNGYTGSNGAFKAHLAAIVLDLQNKGEIYFFGEGCEPATPPAGRMIYHVLGEGPTEPDIYRMSLDDLKTRASYEPEMAHADSDWGHEYFPSISNDNQWLTYGASTGCHDQDTCDYEIFVHRLGAGSDDRTRVTFDKENDQWPHMYVLSPPEPEPDAGPGGDGQAPPKDDEGDGCALSRRAPTGPPSSILPLLLLLFLLIRREP